MNSDVLLELKKRLKKTNEMKPERVRPSKPADRPPPQPRRPAAESAMAAKETTTTSKGGIKLTLVNKVTNSLFVSIRNTA